MDLGGSDKGTIDWFKHLDRERWAPSLITTQPSANRWLHHVEPYAEEVWDLPELMPGAAFPEFILGFIESRGVRVVHIMNSRLAFDLLADMTCLPEAPAVVVQLHAEEPGQAGYVRYVTRRYGNLVDAFSVTSEHLKQIVVDYEIAPSKVEVIHSGVDAEEEFDPDRVEPLELAGNGTPRVLWPGRLVEQKDPMLTLEVLRLARDRGGEFVLDIVGAGHLERQVRDRADELGVAEMIAWHPPSQEMPRWYRSSDLLLMTSVYEGVPYVIYEALAMGVPVVAPALPGNVELMDDESGVLVDPRDDAERYAEAIVSLLGDERRRGEMGERSRRRMLEEFSLTAMGRRHGELYDRFLAGQTASSRWRNEQLFGDEDAGAETGPAPPPLRLEREPPPERTVGVVVPCYRHGIFLPDCIESIRAQTHAPAQVVVVDDGSDDPETIAALAELDADPEIEVVRQPRNLGPSAARNRGLARLRTSYMLPIDADDALLPDALERMLEQLEAAPADVGFVYPHAQHIGNRSDYLVSPAYNVWLLMQQNYCPAPALFDMRLFGDGGVAYPEEIVVGHEDWDVILQLAERGVRGQPASGPTFLYRRQGLSRVNAVDFGPDSFHATIERRHPHLYGNRDEIKARWAPALSIVLLDDDGGEWTSADVAGLGRQTCSDLEAISRRDLGDAVRVAGSAESAPTAWLQEALWASCGRWVLLLPHSSAAVLDSVCLAEQLLHCFIANDAAPAVALAAAPGGRLPFSQLDAGERRRATPAAVAFERPFLSRIPAVELGRESSLLADLVVGLQANGPVQWRAAPAAGAAPPWADPAPPPAAGIDLNRRRSEDQPEETMLTMVGAERARLPEMTRGTVRRWSPGEPWTPPRTRVLHRHVDARSGFRRVSFDRTPPPGYELERVLGALHIFAAPGLGRLVHAEHGFHVTSEQGELPDGHFGLGYIEQQPLPMLEGLELRRVPATGQEVLVSGPLDPLHHGTEALEGLGYVEPVPILPRAEEVLRTGPWRALALRRQAESGAWRHSYSVDSGASEGRSGEVLGYLHRNPAPGLVALRLRKDGRLASDLSAPGSPLRNPGRLGMWAARRLLAARRGEAAPAAGLGVRTREVLRSPASRRMSSDEGTVLGWLRVEAIPGSSLLYSSIHPITGDQLATPSAEEAAALGYRIDGVLGAILDPA